MSNWFKPDVIWKVLNQYVKASAIGKNKPEPTRSRGRSRPRLEAALAVLLSDKEKGYMLIEKATRLVQQAACQARPVLPF